MKLLHRHHRLCGGVRHGGELAVAADPDIALAIGERGVEQRDIGPDRREQHDRIVIVEGIADDLPVLPMREHVGAEQPAQRHERNTLLRRLERGVQRRAGRVLHPDRARRDGCREARRRAEFAEAHRGGLDRRHAARADEQVGLQARGRQRDEVQAFDAAADQRARRRHGDARRLARYGQHTTIGDGRQSFLDRPGDHGQGLGAGVMQGG